MICPNCYLYISNPDADICPRCGQPQSDTQERGQEQVQRPYEPPYRPGAPSQRAQTGSYTGYGNQSYPDQSDYDQPNYDQRSSSQGYQGSGNQRFQPTFSAPATPRWSPPMEPAPPPRKPSVARRILVFGGIFLGGGLLFLCLCIGGLFLLGASQAGHKAGIATATPFPGTTPNATILYQDPLTSPTSGWANDGSRCFFQDSSYYVQNNTVCYAPAGDISDANFTVQAKQVAGSLNAAYGIIFRREDINNWYEFDIDSNSKWVFLKVVNGQAHFLVNFTPNLAIKGGLNSVNTLLVQAKGSHFTFFVNGANVGQADDSTFVTGLSGLGANQSIEVAYNNLQITAAS
jgi:hypothetical protein